MSERSCSEHCSSCGRQKIFGSCGYCVHTQFESKDSDRENLYLTILQDLRLNLDPELDCFHYKDCDRDCQRCRIWGDLSRSLSNFVTFIQERPVCPHRASGVCRVDVCKVCPVCRDLWYKSRVAITGGSEVQ